MFSLLTLNIWNNEGPYAEREKLLRAWIDLLQPDVVALQEVLRGRQLDQLAALTPEYSYRAYAAQSRYWNDRTLEIGVGLASRHPLSSIAMQGLPSDDTDPRVALAANIDFNGREVPVVTTHLSFAPTAARIRLQQAKALSAIVAERRNLESPVIVCGDLNDVPESDAVSFLLGHHAAVDAKSYLIDAWSFAPPQSASATFARDNVYLHALPFADRRIDYVLVSVPPRTDFGRIRSCRRVADIERRGVHPSDHYGVFVELY